MKRRELERRLRDAGCRLSRHGRSHDWYVNPITGAAQAVPRHVEIRESLASSILKAMSAEYDAGKERA